MKTINEQIFFLKQSVDKGDTKKAIDITVLILEALLKEQKNTKIVA